LVVTMDGSTFTYSVTDADGGARPVSKSGFTVVPGDSVVVTLAGVGETGSAAAWLQPEGRAVGTAELPGGEGTVTVTFDDRVDPGDKRLVLVAPDRAGSELVITQGLRVSAAESSGTSWSTVLVVILFLALAAGFLIPAASRRRRDEPGSSASR
jgi:hypothetical protein